MPLLNSVFGSVNGRSLGLQRSLRIGAWSLGGSRANAISSELFPPCPSVEVICLCLVHVFLRRDMRIFFKCTPSYVRRFHSSLTSKDASKQLIHIENATFYRKHPSSSPSQEEASINPPLFLNLDFSLSAENEANQHWAIIGPSNAGKTTFLELLQGQHICLPPRARSFPYLLSDEIKNKGRGLTYAPKAIHYVGFGGRGKGLSGLGTHMSARYESRREVSDFSLLEYLIGKTQLNAATTDDDSIAKAFLDEVIRKLDLEDLLDMPAANLSNGQTRRARLAKALLGRPELLLIDEPFSTYAI